MTVPAWRRTTALLAKLLPALTVAMLLAALADLAWAQAGPFGVPRQGGASAAQSGGVIGWILAKQAEFYRQFSGLIRAAKVDGSAAWTLFGLSFLYGVFHAAGPGHGKAVISSYVVANEETWTRGVVLSFASAMLQAVVAVAIVGVAAALLNASAAAMRSTVNLIEILSYALIVLIGLRLLWVKGRAFVDAARSLRRPAAVGAAVTAPAEAQAAAKGCGHMHGPGHAQPHDTAHRHAHCHEGDRHAQDSHACAWDHAHAPEPHELAGAGGWRRGFAAIVAVGLRPCSGAVLVLVFALAQGLFWTGVVSTFLMGLGTAATVAAIATLAVAAKGWARRFADRRSGQGMLAMRAVEVAAAAVLIAFGALLLTGYLASERMVGV